MKIRTALRLLILTALAIGAFGTIASAQWARPDATPVAAGTPDPTQSNNEAPLARGTEPVNDFANVIDDAAEIALNRKIRDFMERTNPPVALAVVTVRTTGGRDAFEYSLALARGWKLGSDRDDNPSALLFVAIDDRKFQTQISRDLEDELQDSLAGQIQRQYLVPAFKAGEYTKGINDTIDAYIRRIEERQKNGGQTASTPTQPVGRTDGQRYTEQLSNRVIRYACCAIILLIILAIIFSRGNKGGGGSYRGGGGGSALPWIIGSILANSGSSSGSSWGSSGGSSWGGSSDWGGSSGGGSSDWGGFGGGGDFGGGGSGGSW